MKNKMNQSDTLIYDVDNTIGTLTNSVYQVTHDVNNINLQVDDVKSQVNDMKNNVQSLENEIRNFINEMKQNAKVNDAKQTIMMSQLEYDKKYKHRDEVRRRTIGLLQAADINLIKKSTMDTISEETIVNNPDYWLAHALTALCYWYTNNKTLAEKALQKALEKSDEKTSFLFCLIHLRGHRINTAIKWLKRYLSLQDPTNMDCKIILLIDALCSGIFGSEIVDVILTQIKNWKIQLNNYPQYENKQISMWEQYFNQYSNPNNKTFDYINYFVQEKDIIQDMTIFSSSNINMIKEFKDKLNKTDNNNTNHQNKIDQLLNILILDYEQEELELTTTIKNNNFAINETISNKDTLNIEKYNYNKTDFYTHISNICLIDDMYDVENHTRNMAIAMSKENIIKAYQNVCNQKEQNITDINIDIAGWRGKTKNGENELELKKLLHEYIKDEYKEELSKYHLFSKEMIISIIVSILVIIFAFKYLFITIPAFIIVLIFNIYSYKKNYKLKQNKQEEVNKNEESMNTLLMCVISNIVDYSFEHEEFNKIKQEFIEYINLLDYQDYIKTYAENKRNIIIGDIN